MTGRLSSPTTRTTWRPECAWPAPRTGPTRRQDRFLSAANYRRLEEIRARRDPEDRFVSYLSAGREGLNVHG